jgi:hypothetical protein
MDICVCIQCFCKPIETLSTLKSLEQCSEIKQLNLLLFIDKAPANSKFTQKNNELIYLLQKYKCLKQNMYNSITIYIPQKNVGPYIGCCMCVDIAFQMNNFIIFSEDDSIFCMDSIRYYNQYREGIIPNTDPKCLGITSQSNHFYCNSIDVFNNVNNTVNVKISYNEQVEHIKQNVLSNELLNKIETVNWAPNKQFGMFKHNWNKIRYFRTVDYLNTDKAKVSAADAETGFFVKENNYYFYNSIVPRTNDIGLFNELGCTTLFFSGTVPIYTIKYITSDTFTDISKQKNYEIIGGIPITTIL